MAAMRMTIARMAQPARSVPVRAFSAEHSPPVKLFGIPARYANATYTAASKQGVLDQVETELLGFKSVLATKPAFADYMSNPTVSRDEKVKAIDELFSGPKTSKVMKNLMSTLAGNNRVTEADKVADAYLELMKAKRGELDAVVTSATKLSKAQMAKVTDVLKATAKGKAVSITSQVDESILGGLTLQIGDKFLDLSVKSKIDAYTKSLHSA